MNKRKRFKKNIWKKSLSGLLSVAMIIGLVLGTGTPLKAQAEA